MFDDFARNRQAEPASLSLGFVRKERLGGSLGDLGTDAAAVIDHDERHSFAIAVDRKCDRRTAVGACIACIEEEIDQNLLEKTGLASNLGEIGTDVEL